MTWTKVKEFDLQVMLTSEFSYKKEYQTCMKHRRERLKDKRVRFHSIKTVVGCSNTILGEGFVFFDNLVNYRNICDLRVCCRDCKNAVKKEAYACLLKFDNTLDAIVTEITEASVHELLHLCGHRHRERMNVFLTFLITKDWISCQKFVNKACKTSSNTYGLKQRSS